MLQPTQIHCVTCDVSLRHSKTKPCPEPETIKKYLHDNAGYDGDINEHDKVCYACYRAHLVILKQKDKLISSDADLEKLITTLFRQVFVETKFLQEAIDKSIKRISIYVGKQLLQNSALLLPPVHQLLCQYINEELQIQNLDAEDMTKVTSPWALSNLTAILKHHLIMYNCSVPKYGTLLYRPQVDLGPALAQALWRSQSISTQSAKALWMS